MELLQDATIALQAVPHAERSELAGLAAELASARGRLQAAINHQRSCSASHSSPLSAPACAASVLAHAPQRGVPRPVSYYYQELAPGQQRVPALRLMMATTPARTMTWRLSDDALDGRAGHMRRAIYTGGRCLHGARQRTGVSGRGGSAYEQLYSSLHGPESRRASGLRGRGTRRVSGRMWMRGLLPTLSTVRTGPSGM